jgi:hypothetical protein
LAGGWKIRYFLHKKMNMVLFQYRDDTLVERSFRHRRIGIKASMKTHPGDLAFRKGHRRLAEATAAVLLIILQPLAADDQRGGAPGRNIAITITAIHCARARQPGIIREWYAQHPGVRLQQWGGVNIPCDSGLGISLPMAMAGDIGPDICAVDVRQGVEQRLLYPLSEWVGQDGVFRDGLPKLLPDGRPDRNGQIDADEARWEGWTNIIPILRNNITVDGSVYALPYGLGTYVGILYSKRLLQAAGLDPKNPPRTWDDFIYWCRRLYRPDTKTFGVMLYSDAWAFNPWVVAAGDSIIVQERRSPTTGKVYPFDEQAVSFIAPDTGEDLQRVPPRLRTNVSGPGSLAALRFFQRLRWAPWIRDPQTGEPIELSETDRQRGLVRSRGQDLVFGAADVIEGCVCVPQSFCPTTEEQKKLGRDVALMVRLNKHLTELEGWGIDPDDLGIFPFPGMTERQAPVLQLSTGFLMLGKDVAHRGGRSAGEQRQFRQYAWELLAAVCSPETADEDIQRLVASGQARFVNPLDLKRLGLTDYLNVIPAENMRVWNDLQAGRIRLVIEPFMGKWNQFRSCGRAGKPSTLPPLSIILTARQTPARCSPGRVRPWTATGRSRGRSPWPSPWSWACSPGLSSGRPGPRLEATPPSTVAGPLGSCWSRRSSPLPFGDTIRCCWA